MNSATSVSNDLRTATGRVADALTDASDAVTDQTKKLAQSAADTVKDASDYVRDNRGEIGNQIKDYLKANPSHALIGAAAVGFFLGRLMSRD